MEGKEDVQSGDARKGETGLHGGGYECPGSGAGVWATPGHGEEDALSIIRIIKLEDDQSEGQVSSQEVTKN